METNRTLEIIRNEIERQMKYYDEKEMKAWDDWENGDEDALWYQGHRKMCAKLLSFLDTLESEKPINPGDAMKELEEKIALVKQRGTWDGVDVDKYMDEVRGREPEKPMDQDGLEDEVYAYMDEHFDYNAEYNSIRLKGNFFPSPSTLLDIARHFAQWGAEHAKIDVTDFCKPIAPGIAQCIADHSWEMLGEDEKPVPNDLEEAAKNYALNTAEDSEQYSARYLGYKDGAKWQKEQGDKELSEKIASAYQLGLADKEKQMLKEAVEGTVMDFSSNRPRPQVDVLLDPHKYHTGDKVRIIVLKKED